MKDIIILPSPSWESHLKSARGLRMKVTLELPDDLASQLPDDLDELQRFIEVAVRKQNRDRQATFSGIADLLETLAALPTPQEILEMRPSASLQSRTQELLLKNRTSGLTPDEEQEWQQYEFVEHLMRLAKARAAQKLKARDE